MTFTFWLQFVAVCFFGAISPGPSLALIIRNSLKFNRTSGILSAIGHGVGIGIYATLAILGLHLILSSNIYVFKSSNSLKKLGTNYSSSNIIKQITLKNPISVNLFGDKLYKERLK